MLARFADQRDDVLRVLELLAGVVVGADDQHTFRARQERSAVDVVQSDRTAFIHESIDARAEEPVQVAENPRRRGEGGGEHRAAREAGTDLALRTDVVCCGA